MNIVHFLNNNNKLDASGIYDRTLGKTQEEINAAGNTYDILSTGDDTDRTAEIIALIESNHVCRFAPGTYYISDITSQAGFSLIGAGVERTRLVYKAIDASSWYAIRLKADSYIGQLTLDAYREDGSEFEAVSEDYSAGIHGLVIGSNAKGNSEQDTADYKCRIENVLVKNFTGCGVFIRHAGNGAAGAVLTSVRAENCCCGIYLGDHAEYSEVVACSAIHCYTGIVMMGGNNMLSTSYFAGNKININLAETDAYSNYAAEGTRNDAHSLIVGCKAGHVGYSSTSGDDDASENVGENEYCIKAGANKSIFTIADSMFTGPIYVKDRIGRLMFTGCVIKKDSEIISDNSCIIFFDTMFQNNNPNISVSLLNRGKIMRRGCLTYNLLDLQDLLPDKTIWVQGGISIANGKRRVDGQTLYDTRISTKDFIQVNKGTVTFNVPEGWIGRLFYYDTPDFDSYLGQSTGTSGNMGAGAHEDITVPSDYLLVMMAKADAGGEPANVDVSFNEFTAEDTIVLQE